MLLVTAEQFTTEAWRKFELPPAGFCKRFCFSPSGLLVLLMYLRFVTCHWLQDVSPELNLLPRMP
jgi:hypothetical protein